MFESSLPVLVPLAAFALAASITPGPNVIMLAASGANYGFLRTVPHMLGISIGYPVMLLVMGLGLDQVFQNSPQIHMIMKFAGSAYLVYFAYRIATAERTENVTSTGKPLSFVQAALFQWINPKAWVMGISAIATFTKVGDSSLGQILVIGGVFMAASVPSVSVWCGFGVAIGRILRSPAHFRIFNLTMALLLVASISLLYF